MREIVEAIGWLAEGELNAATGRRFRALNTALAVTDADLGGLAETRADYLPENEVAGRGDAALALLAGLAGTAMASSNVDRAGFADACLVRPALADRPRDAAEILLAAMINATKVNGPIDRKSQARLLSRLEAAGADPTSLAQVAANLASPLDLDDLAERIRDTRTATEVYLASALAIETGNVEGRQYLDRLSARIGLQMSTRRRIDTWLGHDS